jgi:hypothetical protein
MVERFIYSVSLLCSTVAGGALGFLIYRVALSRLLPAANRRRHKIARWLIPLATAAVGYEIAWWPISPWWYIAAVEDFRRAGDPDPEGDMKALAALGTRAVDPILTSIRGHSVFYRGTCLLPDILKRIGPPAHTALIKAVDHESDPRMRIGWIYALHEQFKDDSRLHLWVDYSLKQRREDYWLRNVFVQAYPDAPRLGDGKGGINQEFADWYARLRQRRK